MARKRRRTRSRKSAPKRRRRASRKGSTLVEGIAGTALGASAAIGGAAVLNMAANAAKVDLPQAVKDYGPLVGAGVVAGLTQVDKRFKKLAVPALIGGGLVFVLNKYLMNKAGSGRYGAYGYNRLRGAGNVAGTLNAPRGAGNVSDVLNTTASVR